MIVSMLHYHLDTTDSQTDISKGPLFPGQPRTLSYNLDIYPRV